MQDWGAYPLQKEKDVEKVEPSRTAVDIAQTSLLAALNTSPYLYERIIGVVVQKTSASVHTAREIALLTLDLVKATPSSYQSLIISRGFSEAVKDAIYLLETANIES